MAAMEPCCDVLHLEDSIWIGFKHLKKLGNLKYYLLSTLMAMVKIFHALQCLWAALFPFVLLWWNVMLYATCSKYYSWNLTELRLQIAGSSFHGDVIQDRCSHPEKADDEESEESLPSSCQRESRADASHTDRVEITVFSPFSEGTCGDVVCYELEKGGCSIAHEECKLQHLHHDFDACTYRGNWLHMLNPCGGIASAFLDVLRPSVLSVETVSPASDAQALVAPSQAHISKLSSLCFLDGVSHFLDSRHLVVSASLSRHRVPPLAMFDVFRCFQIPVDVNVLTQGKLSDLSGLLLGDGGSVDMSVLRAGILGSHKRNHKVPSLRFLLSTSISDAPSANNVMVSREVRIIGEPCEGDSDCSENRTVDDEGTCSATIGSSEGLNDMDEDYSVQSYGNDDHCSYDCYDSYTDSSVDNFEHVHDVEESLIPPGTSAVDVVYEHCLQWKVGYHDQFCVKDEEYACSMDCDLEDEIVESRGAFYDICRVFEDGLNENPVGAREISVAELDTWWDEGAVFIDNQATGEDTIGEPEWEMV